MELSRFFGISRTFSFNYHFRYLHFLVIPLNCLNLFKNMYIIVDVESIMKNVKDVLNEWN